MEQLLEISHVILMVGGALSMIVFLFLLLYVFSIVRKARNMVKQTEQAYQQAIYFALSPLQKLTDRLGTDLDEEEDDDW